MIPVSTFTETTGENTLKYEILEISNDGLKPCDLKSFSKIAGVWFLVGQNIKTDKQECMQVATTDDINNEIKCDLKYLKGDFKPIYKDYYNDFHEYQFSYIDYGDTLKNHLYQKIAKEYQNLYFICIRCESGRDKLEKYIAWKSEATFWRNSSRPFTTNASEHEIENRKCYCKNEAKKMRSDLKSSVGEMILSIIDEITLTIFFDDLFDFIAHPEWIRHADEIADQNNSEIQKNENGVIYSLISDSANAEPRNSEYIIYKGSTIPVLDDIIRLGSRFDEFTNIDDNSLSEDVVICCTKEHFKLLMQVD